MLTKRDLLVSLTTICGTLGAITAIQATPTVIGQSVFPWDKMVAHPTAVGEVRSVAKGPTATLDELEMHVTTLNPGQSPHPPHRHPNEELIILDKGIVETLVDGKWIRVEPGSVIFNASNALHGLRNVGDSPAQYHVVSFRTEKTPRQ